MASTINPKRDVNLGETKKKKIATVRNMPSFSYPSRELTKDCLVYPSTKDLCFILSGIC